MNSKILVLASLLLAAFALASDAQSRTNTISRPCPATTTLAVVEVRKDGNVNIVPCPTKTLWVRGAPFSITGISSLNGLIGSTQTFAIAAGNFAAWNSASTTHTLTLPITSLGGAARSGFVPYFDGENSLGKSGFTFDGTSSYAQTNAAGTATFKTIFNASNIAGRFAAGDCDASRQTCIDLSKTTDSLFISASNAIQLASAGTVTVGSSGGTVSFPGSTILLTRTVTAAGTTGAQTINKPVGSVNFAAGASAIAVTNSTVTATSLIFVSPQKNDATCAFKAVAPAAGSFVITMTNTCTAETPVAFWVTN